MVNATRLYVVTLGRGVGSALALATEIVRADFQDRAADEALARREKVSGLAWDVLAVHEALPSVRPDPDVIL